MHKGAPVKSFATEKAFEIWLEHNHAKSKGLWLRFFKKASGRKALDYKGALDVALCFGWIDSLINKYDEESYIHKFTPRGPKSIWSRVNREHVARLAKAKRMRPAGLAAVEAAKANGQWEAAYDSSKDMQIPADFLAMLKKDKKAYAFYKTLNRANTYAIAWRLNTAKKAETRARRAQALLAMLKAGKKLH